MANMFAPVPEGQNMFANTTSPEVMPSKTEALFWLSGMGLSDSIRGATQQTAKWTDNQKVTDTLSKQQEKIEMLLDHYGAPAYAAYYTGMFADPVGWALPVSRLKHIKTFADFGKKFLPMAAGSGAVAGGLSYIPEGTQSLVGEGDMSRLEMAGLGAAAAAVAAGHFLRPEAPHRRPRRNSLPRRRPPRDLWRRPDFQLRHDRAPA